MIIKLYVPIIILFLYPTFISPLCNYGIHEMYIIIADQEKIGLNKNEYFFILKTLNEKEKNMKMVVVRGSLPFNFGINFAEESVYEFIPKEKICLEDFQIEANEDKPINLVSTVYGQFKEYDNDNILLHNVIVHFKKVYLFESLLIDSYKKNNFILLTNYEKEDQYVMMMKVINLNNDKNSFFQIVSMKMKLKNDLILEDKGDKKEKDFYISRIKDYNQIFPIGKQFILKNPLDENELILKNDCIYNAKPIDGSEIYEITKTYSYLCLKWDGEKFIQKCFET